MGLEKTEKQGYERYYVHGDFSEVMASDETITADTVIAEDVNGVDVTSDVIDVGTEYVEGMNLFVRIKDGVEALSPYKFTIRVETSIGNRWEVDGQIKIKER